MFSQRTPLQPYLGPLSRYTLTPISHILLSLLTVALAIILAIAKIQSSTSEAKAALRASCLGVESAATVAVSIPHFTADNVNKLVSSGIENSVHGLGFVLDLGVQSVEAISIFMIDTYRSLYLCLGELAVRGSLAALIEGTEAIDEALQVSFGAIKQGLQAGIGGVEDTVTKAIDAVNKISPIDIPVPDFNIPQLSLLDNVSLPDGIQNSLVELNNSLPTLEELKEEMNKIISIPFEALRGDINGTIRQYQVNTALFPIPQTETVVFCQDLDVTFVDDIASSLIKFSIISLVLILVGFLLILAFQIFKERAAYRTLVETIETTRELWFLELEGGGLKENVLSRGSLFTFLEATKHPVVNKITSKYLFKWFSVFRKSPQARTNAAWFFAYISHPPAFAFLLIGLLGITVIQIQLAAAGILKDSLMKQADQSLNDFGDQVTNKINSNMLATSQEWVEGINVAIQEVQDDINTNLLGFVNTTTTTMNVTLNSFYDGLIGAVNSTFSGTPLDEPILGIINCLLGTKVAGISKALTFIHDNAVVIFPPIDNETMVLSQKSTGELVKSLNTGGITENGQEKNNLALKIYNEYVNFLKSQRVGFIIFIAIWLFVLFMGIIGVVFNHYLVRRSMAKEEEEMKNGIRTSPVWGGVGDSSRGVGKQFVFPNISVSKPKWSPPFISFTPITSFLKKISSAAGRGHSYSSDRNIKTEKMGVYDIENRATDIYGPSIRNPISAGVKQPPQLNLNPNLKPEFNSPIWTGKQAGISTGTLFSPPPPPPRYSTQHPYVASSRLRSPRNIQPPISSVFRPTAATYNFKRITNPFETPFDDPEERFR